tara:strand:- start:29664 stop:30143 length:480 start_codon:yes stop_codon:yes gene_type:complete
LVGEKFFKATNIQPLPDISILQTNDQKILLMHGDTLCTDDKEYQKFRKLTRSVSWKENFLSKSLDERMKICKELRDKSEKAKKNKEEYIMDVNPGTVQKVFSKYNFPPFLIHGHTHRLKTHEYIFGKHECQRWVLGDWHREGNYISFIDNQLKYGFLVS